MLSAGELNKRITLQAKSVEDNSIGGYTETWNDLATVWASVEPLQGKELLQAQQMNSVVSTKIKIRYRKGITSDMRISYGGKYYNIKGNPINPGMRNEELHLMCEVSDIEQK